MWKTLMFIFKQLLSNIVINHLDIDVTNSGYSSLERIFTSFLKSSYKYFKLLTICANKKERVQSNFA